MSRSSLGIHTASILSTASTGKGTSRGVFPNALVNLVLSTGRVAETALGVGRLEDVLVGHFDADEAVGQVGVGSGPILKGPRLVSQNHLHHEHV